MFKNATLLKLTGPTSLEALTTGAECAPFVHCGPTQPLSIGFVPPRSEANGALVESIGGQWIMRAMIETKSVPNSEITKRAEALAKKMEHDTGRKPGRKAMKELKEQVFLELLPAAFPKQSAVTIWIDLKRGRVVMDTASVGKSDQVASLMVKAVAGLGMAPLMTQDNPAAACNSWLTDGMAPDTFSLGRDTELRDTSGSKAAVKYKAHDLDTDEIKGHIRQGYTTKRLGLNWRGRVGFALDPELMVMRSIDVDGVVFEEQAEAGFDADVAIITGELSGLLDDLVYVLGGEMEA